jgi:hypothetical protein
LTDADNDIISLIGLIVSMLSIVAAVLVCCLRLCWIYRMDVDDSVATGGDATITQGKKMNSEYRNSNTRNSENRK